MSCSVRTQKLTQVFAEPGDHQEGDYPQELGVSGSLWAEEHSVQRPRREKIRKIHL